MGSARVYSVSKTHHLKEMSIYLGVSHVKETQMGSGIYFLEVHCNMQCVLCGLYFSNLNHLSCPTFQQNKAVQLDLRLLLEMS